MNYLEHNLALIEPHAPQICRRIREAQEEGFSLTIEPAKNGSITAAVCIESRRYLHSRYNPAREANNIVAQGTDRDADVVIIGGFALGYLAEAALDHCPRAEIVVVEKSPCIMRRALETRDLTRLLSSGRFDFVLSEHTEDVTMLLDGKATRNMSMLIHRPSLEIFPGFYGNLRNVLYSYINSKEVNLATLARFEDLWTRNLLRNLPLFVTTPGINALDNALQGVPAFIVGAGPSLAHNIQYLRDASRKGIVIAVDTVYKVLLAHNIRPHVVVAVDPQLINFQYFRGVSPTGVTLVADCAVSPTLLRSFSGDTYISAVPFPFADWFTSFFGARGGLASGGSVSTSAFDLAVRMGCSPVVLVGQDLAYSVERIHVRGTAGEETWENSCRRTTPLTGSMRRFLRDNRTVRMPAYGGRGEVWTDRKFLTFLWWFEKKIAALEGLPVWNATEGGVRIKGSDEKTLQQVLQLLPDQTVALPSCARRAFSLPRAFQHRVRELCAFLERVARDTDEGVRICAELLEKAGNRADRAREFARLELIDHTIRSDPDFSRLLSSTLQRVIHSIQEGFSLGEDEAGEDEQSVVLQRSRLLYQEIGAAAATLRGYIRKYILQRFPHSHS